jgi:hypothetical protein
MRAFWRLPQFQAEIVSGHTGYLFIKFIAFDLHHFLIFPKKSLGGSEFSSAASGKIVRGSVCRGVILR